MKAVTAADDLVVTKGDLAERHVPPPKHPDTDPATATITLGLSLRAAALLATVAHGARGSMPDPQENSIIEAVYAELRLQLYGGKA